MSKLRAVGGKEYASVRAETTRELTAMQEYTSLVAEQADLHLRLESLSVRMGAYVTKVKSLIDESNVASVPTDHSVALPMIETPTSLEEMACEAAHQAILMEALAIAIEARPDRKAKYQRATLRLLN